MASVSLKKIKKSFHKNEILGSINLDIKDGEFIVVLGPSGCGKSTMLRMIAGLESVTEGEIFIGNQNVTKLEPKDRSIAMVFQNYALYPHMTVYKNIAYGLKLHKVPKIEIEKKVQIAVEMLQLKDLLNRKPSELSGGQRQRVAMGRALVREPNVFLFDEPLSNLDAKLRTQMRFEIKNIHKNVRTTSIYVTHDQIEAMTLADRIVLLNKGKIEQIGTPHELYDEPQTLFVAGFIGNPPMNFIAGYIAKKYFNILKIRDNLTVGIRPEKIIPSLKSDKKSIPFCVKIIEIIGHEILMYGNIENSNCDMIIKTNDPVFETKNHIYLKINDKDLHFFDNQTGKKIN